MVHVNLNLLRIPDKETFLVDLKKSLRFYGEVYQVKRYTCGGFFEGEISVVLDTKSGYSTVNGDLAPCQPLERMLYLSVWDTFVPATFKGAKRVCNFCRKAGHVVKNCPSWPRSSVTIVASLVILLVAVRLKNLTVNCWMSMLWPLLKEALRCKSQLLLLLVLKC